MQIHTVKHSFKSQNFSRVQFANHPDRTFIEASVQTVPAIEAALRDTPHNIDKHSTLEESFPYLPFQSMANAINSVLIRAKVNTPFIIPAHTKISVKNNLWSRLPWNPQFELFGLHIQCADNMPIIMPFPIEVKGLRRDKFSVLEVESKEAMITFFVTTGLSWQEVDGKVQSTLLPEYDSAN